MCPRVCHSLASGDRHHDLGLQRHALHVRHLLGRQRVRVEEGSEAVTVPLGDAVSGVQPSLTVTANKWTVVDEGSIPVYRSDVVAITVDDGTVDASNFGVRLAAPPATGADVVVVGGGVAGEARHG